MRARHAAFSEIPKELIRQKPEIDAGKIEMFDHSPDMFAFTLHEGDEVVGVTWMSHGKLYNQVFVDTLIIDEKHRSMRVLREAVLMSYEIALAVAKERGAVAVTTNVRAPRYFLRRLIPEATQVSTTIKVEVV